MGDGACDAESEVRETTSMASDGTVRKDVHVYNCCVCSNRTSRSKRERDTEGTFVPRMSGPNPHGAAPTRTAGRSEEWARRFDAAVSELAAIAGEINAAATSPDTLEMHDAVSS